MVEGVGWGSLTKPREFSPRGLILEGVLDIGPRSNVARLISSFSPSPPSFDSILRIAELHSSSGKLDGSQRDSQGLYDRHFGDG